MFKHTHLQVNTKEKSSAKQDRMTVVFEIGTVHSIKKKIHQVARIITGYLIRIQLLKQQQISANHQQLMKQI